MGKALRRQKSGLPQELVHTTCGHAMLPLLVCRSCREPIEIGNMRVEIVAEPDERQVSCRSIACTPARTPGAGRRPDRARRRRDRRSLDGAGAGGQPITACTGSRNPGGAVRADQHARGPTASARQAGVFSGRRTRTTRRGMPTGSPRKGARCTCLHSRCTNGRTGGCCAGASRRSTSCTGRAARRRRAPSSATIAARN